MQNQAASLAYHTEFGDKCWLIDQTKMLVDGPKNWDCDLVNHVALENGGCLRDGHVKKKGDLQKIIQLKSEGIPAHLLENSLPNIHKKAKYPICQISNVPSYQIGYIISDQIRRPNIQSISMNPLPEIP